MLPITAGATSFKYGPFEIPYNDVTGAGVAIREGRHVTTHTLLIAYQLSDQPKRQRIFFRLKPGPEGDDLVRHFQAKLGERWLGNGGLFEMNRRLGFSNKPALLIVAAIVVLTVVGVTGALLLSVGSQRAPHPRDTYAPPHR